MPIYEYKCLDCGHEWEEFFRYLQVKIMERNRLGPLCINCCSKRTKKLMSASNSVVKGFNEKNGYSNIGGQ